MRPSVLEQIGNRFLTARGKLLNEHSNSGLHKYTDTVQLFDEGRKSREKVQNIIK